MGRPRIQLEGRKFGKLLVIKFVYFGNYKHAFYLCSCNCGQNIIVRGSHLIEGQKSCGCNKEHYKTGYNIKHGFAKKNNRNKFYNTWLNIKSRTTIKTNPRYYDYGGRGIKLCVSWYKFENFKNDMYESYVKHINKYGTRNTSIDRIDNNDNYYKENCRWATWKIQYENRKR